MNDIISAAQREETQPWRNTGAENARKLRTPSKSGPSGPRKLFELWAGFKAR
jgi:hypothetical protein